MGLGRRASALALVVTLSVMGTALPAHAGEESPPLTLNGRPLSEFRARSGPLDLAAGAMQVEDVILTPGGQGEVARSFQDLSTRVEPGVELSVIDASGNETIGDLLEISDSSLGLRVGQNRLDLAESDVVRIEGPPDPVWNGMAIGAGIAAGAALGIAGAACAAGGCGDDIAPEVAGFVAKLSTLGAGIGALIDWRRVSRQLLFLSPANTASSATVSLAPVLGRDQTGLVLSVSF